MWDDHHTDKMHTPGAPASVVSYSPSPRSSSRVSSFSMMPVISLATSCRVLEDGSDCRSMANTQSGAQGSPGDTGKKGKGEFRKINGKTWTHPYVFLFLSRVSVEWCHRPKKGHLAISMQTAAHRECGRAESLDGKKTITWSGSSLYLKLAWLKL